MNQKKIDNKFVRYGKLHLTKQLGFGGDSFHSPPSSIGFYAFPYRYQEMFLVGNLAETQSVQVNLPKFLTINEITKKDIFEDGEFENRSILFDKRLAYIKNKMKVLHHEFYVDNSNLVWHHLKSPHHEIIDTHGSWNKTTVFEFKRAMKKENMKCRAQSLKISDKKDINSVPKKLGYYSMDHFEVFFDIKVV